MVTRSVPLHTSYLRFSEDGNFAIQIGHVAATMALAAAMSTNPVADLPEGSGRPGRDHGRAL
jgi:hypothetical protein